MLRRQTRNSAHIHMLPSNVQKTQKWLPKSIEILRLLEVFVQVKKTIHVVYKQFSFWDTYRNRQTTNRGQPLTNILRPPLDFSKFNKEFEGSFYQYFLKDILPSEVFTLFNSTYCVDKKVSNDLEQKNFFLATFKAKKSLPNNCSLIFSSAELSFTLQTSRWFFLEATKN